MSKMIAVRREFNEPFVDVVKGFAAMGYSRRATADVLEFSLSYFRQLLVRFDLHGCFLPQDQQRSECRGSWDGTGTASRKRPGNGRSATYSDDDLLRLIVRHTSACDFQASTMIPRSTVHRRFGAWKRARVLAVARFGAA